MPAPGDQHRNALGLPNPFEEGKPHISEFTAQEVATLQSRLEKQLGPEYISSRPGAGGSKVHYIAAEKCIQLANEVFGFNGWSSAVREVSIDFADEVPGTGRWSIGLSVIVRVTLRDGTYHEDLGYGKIENSKSKAAAFEKAKKEGTTDALKRALRNFGNVLGNCIYDKDYLTKVMKLKIAPSKWDSDNLHRHIDYALPKKEDCAPIKKEVSGEPEDSSFSLLDSRSTTKEAEDEFGEAEFDEADFSAAHDDHPDEVVLDASIASARFVRKESPIKNGQNYGTRGIAVQQQKLPPPRIQSMPGVGPVGPQTPMAPRGHNGHQPQKPIPPQISSNLQIHPQHHPQQVYMHRQQVAAPQPIPSAKLSNASNVAMQSNLGTGRGPTNIPVQGSTPPSKPSPVAEFDPPVGFFTARVAETIQKSNAIPPNVPLFNPRHESPSIRKTAGVDHTKTKPVARDVICIQAPSGNIVPSGRTDFVNPHNDPTRRIGMPSAAASPMQNRNAYRPPQMTKRSADSHLAPSRLALNDVTSASVNTLIDNGVDLKRQKLDNECNTENKPGIVLS